jgi:GT2 family glycosyltransferase
MNDSYKCGFVVLHYNVLVVTMKCIDSLLSICKKNTEIVVIDNGSNDGSGVKLLQKYKYIGHVKIIILNKNLGFSRGNNIGYKYLKQKQCDFIILLNNDVYITQKLFIDYLEEDYENMQFDVMGPLIYDGSHNVSTKYPQKPLHNTKWSVYLGQAVCLLKLVLSFFSIDVWIENMIFQLQHVHDNLSPLEKQINVQISGCCIIFARGYIQKFDGLNENTFFYLEEEVLYARIVKNHMSIVYNPRIEVIHLGEVSTNYKLKSKSKRKRRFKYWNQFKSLTALKEELEI